ncbi:MAG: hypothetical protein IKB81_06375 [Paludibacteraceae bacterium]|nr:hypothetical protein [Paludibacteraceae bacterium]
MKKILLFASAVLFSMMSFAVDITITSADAVNQDGVKIVFDKANGQTAPAWYEKGLRLYAKNTVTISANSDITEITFNWEKQGSKDFAKLTANVGNYSHPSSTGAGTWTGSAKEIVFTVGEKGQLQLNTLSVFTGEGGGETPDTPDTPTEPEEPSEPEEPETPETPGTTELEIPAEAQSWNIPAEAIDVLQAREICAGLANNEKSGTKYYVMGYVKELHSKYHASGMEGYGNATFYMENVKGANSTDDFLAFQVMGKNGEKFTNMDAVAVGDFVVVYGELTNYNGTYETTNKGSAYIWNSTNAAFAGGETPETPDTPVTGTEIKGLKYADAYYYEDLDGYGFWDFDLYVALDEESYEYTYPELYIMVDVAKSKTAINGTYGLYWAGVWMSENDSVVSEEGATTGSLTIQNVGNEGQYSFKGSFVATNGKTYTFNETVDVWAFDYDNFEEIELSESTSDTPDTPDTPDNPDTPDPAEMLTCAEASQIAAEENYKGTANVTVYGYVVEVIKEKVDDKTGRNKQSFWMSDTKGGEKQFQAYYAFVPENFFKVGDKVAVTGILQNYKGTIEIADGEAVLLEETAVDDVIVDSTPVKLIRKNQLIIIRDGKAYNVLGAQL